MGRERKKELGEVFIPKDEPVFPVNVVCDLLNLHYWTLHDILREGIIKQKPRSKKKKLFSYTEVKVLKYVKYLMEDKGVNVKGIKLILEMEEEK
ncbi:MAG: MerR family transcriptional regulator [Candidatus Omnitrophica bacterium]|nr:MerR family transcriptional regulator [Candidatus Omnitrophota bacterium]